MDFVLLPGLLLSGLLLSFHLGPQFGIVTYVSILVWSHVGIRSSVVT